MTVPYRALIVSPTRLLCEGLSHRLSGHRTIFVVAAVTNGTDACNLARQIHPNVVLLDASTREFLYLVPVFRELGVLHVVAFAVGEQEADAIMCAQAGVSAFVDRGASLDELVDAVTACGRGEMSISPRLAALLFRKVGQLSNDLSGSTDATLTSREAEILSLLQQGLSNKEIAGRLGIRVPTVKNHVHRLLEKLGVHRRTQAAALVRRRG